MNNLLHGLNLLYSYTLGVVYTAATGKVDPWTAQRQKAVAQGKIK